MVGIGGMAGAIGGMLIAKIVGYVLQWTGSYRVPFLIAGAAYLLALGLHSLLAPALGTSAAGCLRQLHDPRSFQLTWKNALVTGSTVGLAPPSP